jgi:hypothetical protein
MDSYPYSALAFVWRREYEPFMLNGDAHHSLVWEIEPRIWPLLDCQRRVHRKALGANRK